MSKRFSAIKLAITLLVAVSLCSCSHSHEMLWWNMMESHAEFQRVNESVLVRRISSSRNDSMIAALSDPAIAYLETKEAALFDGAK